VDRASVGPSSDFKHLNIKLIVSIIVSNTLTLYENTVIYCILFYDLKHHELSRRPFVNQ